MPHTPGPWFVFENGHCVGGPGETEAGTAGVALCGMRLRTPEEIAANARLIAAAPEMLAALEAEEEAITHFASCHQCGARLTGDVWYCAAYNAIRVKAAKLRCAALGRVRGEGK